MHAPVQCTHVLLLASSTVKAKSMPVVEFCIWFVAFGIFLPLGRQGMFSKLAIEMDMSIEMVWLHMAFIASM